MLPGPMTVDAVGQMSSKNTDGNTEYPDEGGTNFPLQHRTGMEVCSKVNVYLSAMKVSLHSIAAAAGVSAKTVSGALHGGSAAMSAETRERIRVLARDLGYVPNLAARGMRQGRLPIIGIVADGLITAPFATDIMRAFDNAIRAEGLSSVVTSLGSGTLANAVADLERFIPRAVAYASMFHKIVAVPAGLPLRLMINCRDEAGRVPSLVPGEARASADLVGYLVARGRRRLAFLNLPGLPAGTLRAQGFCDALRALDIPLDADWIRPATAGRVYTDRARSRVPEQVSALLAAPRPPDAIVCGNDRVALETYNALRRAGARIPDDVAVASFDNQVDIAARLDPPLTTMALPHRAMGRRAAEILLNQRPPTEAVETIPFRLIERQSA